ncbi:hypothetical protein LTS10_013260 [Elasticomyces elasticus]|nr:hypothetical protein LTS10_013260 [Elasticomyces elasticus]
MLLVRFLDLNNPELPNTPSKPAIEVLNRDQAMTRADASRWTPAERSAAQKWSKAERHVTAALEIITTLPEEQQKLFYLAVLTRMKKVPRSSLGTGLQIPVSGRGEEARTQPDRDTRKTWLQDLGLDFAARSRLQSAIATGDLGAFDFDDFPVANLPISSCKYRLHLMALFGETTMARTLLNTSPAVPALVNESCVIQKKLAAQETTFVTPLHLACGARQEGMVRPLLANGASLNYDGVTTTAPPLWLLSGRWLALVNHDQAALTRSRWHLSSSPKQAKDIIRIIEALTDHGWNVNSSLNRAGDTLLVLARKRKREFRGDWLDPVVEYLQKQ